MHNLGSIDHIPIGEGREFQIGGLRVAVFRARDGSIFALQPGCPHRGGPLVDGITGAGLIVCPLHAYKFELATGRAVGHGCGVLQTYAASVSEAGEILVDAGASVCAEAAA
jgi:nitrite reductase (NADH) small subunit